MIAGSVKRSATDIRIRFGQAIRKYRMVRNMSQEALAERAGLHRTYVADIERGVRNVSLRNIEKLIRALGISFSEFFTSLGKGTPS